MRSAQPGQARAWLNMPRAIEGPTAPTPAEAPHAKFGAYWGVDRDELLSRLRSRPSGLSSAEAAQRRRELGRNDIQEHSQLSRLHVLLRWFSCPFPPLVEVLPYYDTPEPIPITTTRTGPRRDELPLGRDVVMFPAIADGQ